MDRYHFLLHQSCSRSPLTRLLIILIYIDIYIVIILIYIYIGNIYYIIFPETLIHGKYSKERSEQRLAG